MTVTLKPKYISLVQKPSCCNVTCLQMILYRRGFGLFDQEQMAKFFKVKVGPKEQRAFNIRLGKYSRRGFDEDIKTVKSAPLINKFFSKNKIPLAAKAVRASSISNLQKFIADNLAKNNDLWLEFKTHQVHHSESIHDNVIESIATSKNGLIVTAVDPLWHRKPRNAIALDKLRLAIGTKFGRETGFIIIESKK